MSLIRLINFLHQLHDGVLSFPGLTVDMGCTSLLDVDLASNSAKLAAYQGTMIHPGPDDMCWHGPLYLRVYDN